jgi:hypothetical protein
LLLDRHSRTFSRRQGNGAPTLPIVLGAEGGEPSLLSATPKVLGPPSAGRGLLLSQRAIAEHARFILRQYPATAPQRNSDINGGKYELDIGSSSAMRWHTGSASSSSAGIADDIFRLIPLNERAAFREMLEIEFHGRKLSDHEKRRAAERLWRSLLNYGWPT